MMQSHCTTPRKRGRKSQIAAGLLSLAIGLGLTGASLPLFSQARPVLSAEQLHTRMLERRAVEAAIWGMPLVNFDAMRQAYFRDAGARYNDVMYWSRPSDWKNQTTTPNHSTLYVMTFVNLKDGPVVLDVPATTTTGLYGAVLDAWTVPLLNVGSRGQDLGKGGRYLILPPGYEGDVPVGFIRVQSSTYNNYTLLRVITRTTGEQDLADGVNYLKTLKVYPLSKALAIPANNYIDVADKVYDGIARYDASFYESLARMVSEEPVQNRDMSIMGQLSALGIGKGQDFQADPKRQELLANAVDEAHAYMMEGYSRSGVAIWGEQRKWRSLAGPKQALGTKLSFIEPGQGVYLDDRAYAWFAMYGPIVPPGPQVYMKSYETAKGELLEGGNSYRLTIPANAPAKDFWALDVYDARTAGFIREAQVVGLDSYSRQMEKNPDGSVDLYFAPKPPPGHENNWIATQAGQPFFTMFRIYGPEQAMVDRTWVLNDIERLE
ncbi:DUF1254 domain-containing protein [Pseudomonas sp. PCH199]|uniref:DUF1254 domain-containing protein n=1 Tax=unclassified Pseudomonas TaxID=196821 RepID=UPI000BDDD5E7|nr:MULTISPECIES: DUF1254 domain-containing protein [unclassified Pseudomonas]MCW8279204.1 DUF1254 domain-containing protein [Pseudomonas sp. PCH199]PAM78528.1 hypothetical protein CES87_30855 [Pseudomonas sp. ERMR1:02]